MNQAAAATSPRRYEAAQGAAITARRRAGAACAGALQAALLAATMLAGCGGGDTRSTTATAGAPKSAGSTLLEKGAAALQDKPPVEALNSYLDGFHFYSGQMQRQMEAHHYCAMLGEEFIQCVIYDGNVKDAKLMGVEYIVSERLFNGLPAAERALWHSHVHEVKSGQLVAPGIPAPAEHALMQKLIGTYGKTFHTWQMDAHHAVPLGVPQLMMGFTADGQADPAMVQSRDQRLGVASAAKRKDRQDIVAPPVAEGADAWRSAPPVQIADPTAPR